jgi:SAM-dependent methyltransferase
MPSTNSYTRINRYGALCAEVYDTDKPFGHLPDTAFHVARLAGVDGPILEPACGTGRTLVPLLEAGHDVTGFDASPDMLARCQARCAERGLTPKLSQQRFEDFSYDQPFAVIIVPVGTFTLIDDYATAIAVLRRFHAHLAPGGLVILDIQPLASMAMRGSNQRSWTAENGDLLTMDGQHTRSDWLAQRIEYSCRYERWRDHKLVESELEPMAQRLWGLEEFRLALAATGFGDIEVTGDYRPGQPLQPRAGTLTFEARRG